MGHKIRSQGRHARGVRVYAKTASREYWQARTITPLPFFSDQAIFSHAAKLFERAPDDIREIGVTCYELVEPAEGQLGLFGDELARARQVTGAIDDINTRYGSRVIHSADTLGTGIYVKQKIPFGGTRYL